MTILDTQLYAKVREHGVIRDEDVSALRRAFYEDGQIAVVEADALFELNDVCTDKPHSWQVFFVEAITDFLVFDCDPEGYITVANAAWLVARIERDGRVCSLTELELLVNVLDKARWAPDSLSAFALEQVRQAVVSGEGVLRDSSKLMPGVITDADVELLRRVLFAFASCGNMAITKSEAEVLFAIDAATCDSAPCAAWTDLFVKAIANAVLAAHGYSVPSREDALKREAWLNSRGDLSFGNMLSGLVSTSLSNVIGLYREQTPEEAAIARLERQRVEIITNGEVTAAEAEWLMAMVDADGQLSANEIALLSYLKANSPKLHPALEPLLQRAGLAA